MKIIKTDVLIIGGGIAGLMAAEYLSLGKNVIIITKSPIQHSNSYLAQGGISAALDNEDSWENHFSDTIHAGHFHNDFEMTEQLVKEGPRVIHTLTGWGVPFDRDEEGFLHLGKEGGHHQNRIIHAGGDQTGKRVIETLINRVKEKVKIISGQYAIDLVVENNRCSGVYCKDEEGNLLLYKAEHTILAGGGYAGIYATTSNPFGSDGSAICMAYRAGAALADLEFVQFHPTLLKSKYASGLITEAVRGEGGILVNSKKIPIMDGIHPQKDLAPRDIVSRSLFKEIHTLGESVFLDIRNIHEFEKKFPGVSALCKKAQVKLSDGLIPVVPGAHFTMGGIMTDHQGKTTLDGLYAIGECAQTGVHGANRLASNSLLEGAVFAKFASTHILRDNFKQSERHSFIPALKCFSGEGEEVLGNTLLDVSVIQLLMDELAGICRHEERLLDAKKMLDNCTFPSSVLNLSLDVIKRLNVQTMAWLTVTSCLKRKESRGSHFRSDYPISKKEWEQKKIIRSLTHDEHIIAKQTAAGISN
jgi:L-aspartate oxidase